MAHAPLQRVALRAARKRYKLLLQRVVDELGSAHADFPSMSAALLQIEAVATAVNGKLGELKNRSKLHEVQKRFDGDVQLVNRARRFHMEGPLMKASRNRHAKVTRARTHTRASAHTNQARAPRSCAQYAGAR